MSVGGYFRDAVTCVGFSTPAVPNPKSKAMATETTNTEATTGLCAWLRETFGQGPPSNSSQQVTDEAPGMNGTQRQPAEGETLNSSPNLPVHKF